MTCKGYDPKAVKIGKPIKRIADTFTDNHARRQFIRSYVEIAQSEMNVRIERNSSRKEKQA